MNPIAVKVSAESSSRKHSADINKTGQWQVVGNVLLEEASSACSEQGPLLHSATANFSYVGDSTPSPGGPVPLPPIPTTLVLNAGTTKLTGGGRAVLVAGDEVTDGLTGNRLRVSKISRRMRSG